MKFKILTISLIYIFSISIAQNKNIQFETGSFADLKAKAQKENKLIFIDAYTVWCGPCKWMAKNIFTNDTVADFYNSKFINAQIDMEKGEGVEIAKLYNVHCYPSLLYIDGDGKLIHRGAGSSNAQRFINLGENSLIPEKTFSRFESQYESKRTDAKFLSEYLYAISETCLPYKDVLA
ncbi:MAG: thioredoxin family protein, partial [Bacteroidia bacterium]|nr:thioredoxin family protein [Bacteroidia bacterium]